MIYSMECMVFHGDESIPSLLFADDALLLADLADKLQQNLGRMDDLCYHWDMAINIEKCRNLIVNDGREYTFNLGGFVLPRIDVYIYIELPIDKNINILTIINDKKDKSRKAYLSMHPFLTKYYIPQPVKSLFIKGVLLSIATYGCELHGMSDLQVRSLQKVIDNV
ncbi:hypothetical protein DMUE_0313 [Dictyocoela muelleri]|nr:hypothetical protein DMUE_0313 [Dictyocoela muelleri]